MSRCLFTGRDVKVNSDVDAFTGGRAEQNTTEKSKTDNPYTRESSWHGDATLALRLAETASGDPPKPTTNSTTSKQTTLGSFLQNPVRNLNNVLIAGARRATKAAEIVATHNQQKQEQQNQSRGGKRRRSWNNQRDYSSHGCPMYKRIPGTDFVCDGFLYAKSSVTSNYFLTHFHSDHYGGITNTWNTGTIYCSLPTANLVSQELGVDKKYLHPIPMDTPTVIASRGKPVTVTLLDANHCPGAVMFLFEVGKRSILHVGDFRWSRQIMLDQIPLRNFSTQESILDELFLDTTYCNPKYSLPSQEETIKAIMSIFATELEWNKVKQTKTLHLFGAYTIGKEKMYLSVAERFQMKVYVDSARYRILKALDWPEERLSLLTVNKEDASIWVVPLGHINLNKLPDYFPIANSKPFEKSFDRIIGYRPTGWSMGSKPSSTVVSTRSHENIFIHSVPYSEHSSFPELVDCLGCLKPQRIVPTVNATKSQEQVETLLKALKEKQTTIQFAPIAMRRRERATVDISS